MHGGNVQVESRKNLGSTFTVLLNTGPDEEARKPAEEKEKISIDSEPPSRETFCDRQRTDRGPAENKAKVLVIDDNDDVREFVYSSLHSAYSIMEARNGREGFDIAISSVPEVIVSDIMMPPPNGLELCQKLKTNEITSHIPVILLTAKAAEYHQAEGYRNGADSYITKPFTEETLLARIDNLIAGRQRLRNFYFKNAFLETKQSGSTNPESEFLRKCSQFVCENMDNSDLDIAAFCRHMGMSQT